MKAVTLTVLCEGATETRFVSQVLAPHLRPLRVFARTQLLTPHGGVVSFAALRERLSLLLAGRRHECVTTMLDLYELPADFPELGARPAESGVDRAARIQAAMQQAVPDRRFLPYLQVHEFEALVLADLDELARLPETAQAGVERLRRDIRGIAPEEVNDGNDTAPSKRLAKQLPRYVKSVDGPSIAARIGLAVLRERCPHFGEWVRRLEQLAPDAIA